MKNCVLKLHRDLFLLLMIVLFVSFNIGCIYLVKMGELNMLLPMVVVDTVAVVQIIRMIRGDLQQYIEGDEK